MANDLEFIISATDKASAPLEKVEERLKGVTGAATGTGKASESLWKQIGLGVVAGGALSAGLFTLTSSMSDAFEGALENEQIHARLVTALRGTGDASATTVNQIETLATTMQELTGIDDDAAKAAYTYGLQLGFTNDQLQGVLPGAQGLATVFGTDLQSALRMVAMAQEGNFGQLQRLIPELRNASTEAEKLDIVYRKMAEGMDVASGEMETNAGKFKAWKNQVSSDMETLAGAAISAAGYISDLFASGDEKRLRAQAVEAQKEQIANAKKLAQEKLDDLAAEKLIADVEKILGDARKQRARDLLESQNKAAEAEAAAAKKHQEEMKREAEAAQRAQEEYAKLLGTLTRMTFIDLGDFGTPIASDPGLDERIKQMREHEQIIKDLGALLPDFSDIQGGSSSETKQWTVNWKDANEVAKYAESLIGSISGALTDLGIDLSDSTQGLLGFASGVGQVVEGIASKNPAAVIAGLAKAISGLIKALAGDGVGEAIERENNWMGLTKAQIDQLRALEAQYKDTHKATSEMLDEFISSADINSQTIDQWTMRVREILSDLDRGTLTVGETAEQVGDAFEALIAKAEKLGTEGSKAMLELFADLGGRGINVDQIQEYIATQVEAGLEGYKAMKAAMDPTELQNQYNELVVSMSTMVAGTEEYARAASELDAVKASLSDVYAAQAAFGGLSIDVFDEAIAYQKKLADSAPLIAGIKGATEALKGLSATTQISEADYQDYEVAARAAYEQLVAQGFSGKEALLQLQPMLSKLSFLQKEFGYDIDDSTEALIQQAKDSGISMEKMTDPQQKMVDLMGQLVDKFDAFFKSITDSDDAMGGLATTVGNLGKAVRDVGAIDLTGDDIRWGGVSGGIAAADGYHGYVSQPTLMLVGERGRERVDVTPGGGNTTASPVMVSLSMDMTVSGDVSKEAMAEQFKAMLKDNTRGATSALIGAVSKAVGNG